MNQRVYVGGRMGDTPVAVTATIGQAMSVVLDCYVTLNEDDRDQVWQCAFIDGGPDLRWTLTLPDGDIVYVEDYDVDQ